MNIRIYILFFISVLTVACGGDGNVPAPSPTSAVTPTPSVEQNAPYVSVEFDSYIDSNVIEISLFIEDESLISIVEIYHNEELVYDLGDLNQHISPENIFITVPVDRESEDFYHNFIIIVEDEHGNRLEAPFSHTIPHVEIVVTSPTVIASEDYTLTGFVDSTYEVESIFINGVEVVLEEGAFELDLELPLLLNNIDIASTDSIGSEKLFSFEVYVDISSPSVTFGGYQFRVDYGSAEDFGLCDIEELKGSRASIGAICFTAQNISIQNLPVTSSISNEGIVVLGVRFNDGLSGDYITSNENIVLEYRYERDSIGSVIDWTAMTKDDVESDLALLPLSIEFLGEEFYIATLEEQHRIYIRAIDQVGNETIKEFPFRIKMFDI